MTRAVARSVCTDLTAVTSKPNAERQFFQGERFPGARNGSAASWVGDGAVAEERGLSTQAKT